MNHWLLLPPLTFLVMLAFILALNYVLSLFALKVGPRTAESGTPYACGETAFDPMAQPDYSQFFPFAFFFTIAHVATMMLITVPMETFNILILALLYLFAVIVGLFTLL